MLGNAEKLEVELNKNDAAAMAIDALALLGEHLQTRQGDIQTEITVCSTGDVMYFDERPQFYRLQTTVGRNLATHAFERSGWRDAFRCVSFVPAEEDQREHIYRKRLVNSSGAGAMLLTEQTEDTRNYAFRTARLASVDTAQEMLREVCEMSAPIPRLESETSVYEGGSLTYPKVMLSQEGFVPVLGKLMVVAAEVAIQRPPSATVRTSVEMDSSWSRMYQMRAGPSGHSNNVNIFGFNSATGTLAQFTCESGPLLDTSFALATPELVIRNTYETTQPPTSERIEQRDGEFTRVVKAHLGQGKEEEIGRYPATIETIAEMAERAKEALTTNVPEAQWTGRA